MTGIEALTAFGGNVVSTINAPATVGVGRWAFAMMFLLTGFMKLRQPVLAAFAIADFGLSSHARRIHGVTLGLVEVGLAIWLASGYAIAFSVSAAAALLSGFTVLIMRAVRSGESFACFCFGESDSIVSAKTMWRTAILSLAAFAMLPGAIELKSESSSVASLSEIVIGSSIVGILLLTSRVPALLRWDPLRLRAS